METRRPAQPHRSPHGLYGVALAAALMLPGNEPVRPEAALAAGVEIARALGDNESHSYPVSLSAGDFLRVTMRQEGIDAALELHAPDGTPVAVVDGPNPDAEYATEDLAAVVSASGTFQIKVVGGTRIAAPFSYHLRMEAPRPATDADRQREAAMRADQEATNVMAKGGPLQRQLELRETARRICHQLGDRRCEAASQLQLGLVLAKLNRRTAVEELAGAARLWQELGDSSWQARALGEEGHAAAELSRFEDAADPLTAAIALASGPGDEGTRARALNNKGHLLGELGESRDALPLLEQALAIDRRRGDTRGQASVLVNRGYALMDLLETQEALESFRAAAGLQGADESDLAAAHHALGVLHENLGNWDDAIQNYRQALDIDNALDNKKRAAVTLNNQGVVYRLSGKIEESLKVTSQALAIAQEIGAVPVQVQVLTNLGSIYRAMGRKSEAIEAWRQVEPLAGTRRDLEIPALTARAFLHKETGDFPAARQALETSLARAREREDRRWEAEATRALALLEKEQGQLVAALSHVEAALALTESQRWQVASPELRSLFLARKQTYYELALDILMALHREHPAERWNERAVRISERARARSFLDVLATGVGARRGTPPEILERERRARADLSTRDLQRLHLIQEGAPAERIAEADRRLTEALARFDDVETELRQSSPAYAALTQPQPLSAAEIQAQVLDRRAVLLEYALGEERSYVWAVTPASVASAELPPRTEIEAAARRYYDALTAQRNLAGKTAAAGREALETETSAAGRALSRMILAPIDPLLGDHTLLVVKDGMLQYVPFTALPLPSGSGLLLARNQVVDLPSASALAVLRRETRGRSRAPKTIALLAGPVFDRDDRRFAGLHKPKPRSPRAALRGQRGTVGRETDALSFPRLRFSEEEAQGIAALVPASQRYLALGFDASVANATSGELGKYRIVHFATHGVLDTAQPELSKLVLSQWTVRGARQDGFLRLADVYGLDLDADLVVLSACRTALGKEIRGEGLIGLTRGFMYAGARRVLASLWSVDDRATATLMKHFYRHLLNGRMPAAAALRQAQREIAADPRWQSPYYWAGFSLQGEWQ